jgi:hypothetical protein
MASVVRLRLLLRLFLSGLVTALAAGERAGRQREERDNCGSDQFHKHVSTFRRRDDTQLASWRNRSGEAGRGASMTIRNGRLNRELAEAVSRNIFDRRNLEGV